MMKSLFFCIIGLVLINAQTSNNGFTTGPLVLKARGYHGGYWVDPNPDMYGALNITRNGTKLGWEIDVFDIYGNSNSRCDLVGPESNNNYVCTATQLLAPPMLGPEDSKAYKVSNLTIAPRQDVDYYIVRVGEKQPGILTVRITSNNFAKDNGPTYSGIQVTEHWNSSTAYYRETWDQSQGLYKYHTLAGGRDRDFMIYHINGSVDPSQYGATYNGKYFFKGEYDIWVNYQEICLSNPGQMSGAGRNTSATQLLANNTYVIWGMLCTPNMQNGFDRSDHFFTYSIGYWDSPQMVTHRITEWYALSGAYGDKPPSTGAPFGEDSWEGKLRFYDPNRDTSYGSFQNNFTINSTVANKPGDVYPVGWQNFSKTDAAFANRNTLQQRNLNIWMNWRHVGQSEHVNASSPQGYYGYQAIIDLCFRDYYEFVTGLTKDAHIRAPVNFTTSTYQNDVEIIAMENLPANGAFQNISVFAVNGGTTDSRGVARDLTICPTLGYFLNTENNSWPFDAPDPEKYIIKAASDVPGWLNVRVRPRRDRGTNICLNASIFPMPFDSRDPTQVDPSNPGNGFGFYTNKYWSPGGFTNFSGERLVWNNYNTDGTILTKAIVGWSDFYKIEVTLCRQWWTNPKVYPANEYDWFRNFTQIPQILYDLEIWYHKHCGHYDGYTRSNLNQASAMDLDQAGWQQGTPGVFSHQTPQWDPVWLCKTSWDNRANFSEAWYTWSSVRNYTYISASFTTWFSPNTPSNQIDVQWVNRWNFDNWPDIVMTLWAQNITGGNTQLVKFDEVRYAKRKGQVGNVPDGSTAAIARYPWFNSMNDPYTSGTNNGANPLRYYLQFRLEDIDPLKTGAPAKLANANFPMNNFYLSLSLMTCDRDLGDLPNYNNDLAPRVIPGTLMGPTNPGRFNLSSTACDTQGSQKARVQPYTTSSCDKSGAVIAGNGFNNDNSGNTLYGYHMTICGVNKNFRSTCGTCQPSAASGNVGPWQDQDYYQFRVSANYGLAGQAKYRDWPGILNVTVTPRTTLSGAQSPSRWYGTNYELELEWVDDSTTNEPPEIPWKNAVDPQYTTRLLDAYQTMYPFVDSWAYHWRSLIVQQGGSGTLYNMVVRSWASYNNTMRLWNGATHPSGWGPYDITISYSQKCPSLVTFDALDTTLFPVPLTPTNGASPGTFNNIYILSKTANGNAGNLFNNDQQITTASTTYSFAKDAATKTTDNLYLKWLANNASTSFLGPSYTPWTCVNPQIFKFSNQMNSTRIRYTATSTYRYTNTNPSKVIKVWNFVVAGNRTNLDSNTFNQQVTPQPSFGQTLNGIDIFPAGKSWSGWLSKNVNQGSVDDYYIGFYMADQTNGADQAFLDNYFGYTFSFDACQMDRFDLEWAFTNKATSEFVRVYNLPDALVELPPRYRGYYPGRINRTQSVTLNNLNLCFYDDDQDLYSLFVEDFHGEFYRVPNIGAFLNISADSTYAPLDMVWTNATWQAPCLKQYFNIGPDQWRAWTIGIINNNFETYWYATVKAWNVPGSTAAQHAVIPYTNLKFQMMLQCPWQHRIFGDNSELSKAWKIPLPRCDDEYYIWSSGCDNYLCEDNDPYMGFKKHYYYIKNDRPQILYFNISLYTNMTTTENEACAFVEWPTLRVTVWQNGQYNWNNWLGAQTTRYIYLDSCQTEVKNGINGFLPMGTHYVEVAMLRNYTWYAYTDGKSSNVPKQNRARFYRNYQLDVSLGYQDCNPIPSVAGEVVTLGFSYKLANLTSPADATTSNALNTLINNLATVLGIQAQAINMTNVTNATGGYTASITLDHLDAATRDNALNLLKSIAAGNSTTGADLSPLTNSGFALNGFTLTVPTEKPNTSTGGTTAAVPTPAPTPAGSSGLTTGGKVAVAFAVIFGVACVLLIIFIVAKGGGGGGDSDYQLHSR